MFKELGEFIDNVGRNVGFFAKKILSKNEPHEMTGIIDESFDEIDELVKQRVITKEEAEELKNVEIHSK